MKSQKGQSIVEFAIVIPMLLLILFGIVDFGRTFHIYLSMNHVGREVARAASIHEDVNVNAIVEGASSFVFENVEVTYPEDKYVRVEINYTVIPITPLIGSITEIPLSNNTEMKLEYDRN